MYYQKIALLLLLCIITVSLEKGYCSEYAIKSKRRFKRDIDDEYLLQFDMNHPPQLPENGSYHKNRHGLPEKAIYCTCVKSLNEGKSKPGCYTNKLECIYPRSVEFPELGDEIPTTPKPKLTGVQKFQQALLLETTNFREFLNKVDKGEKPEPYKRMDVDALTDDIMNDIFHHKPDPLDIVEDSSPNGIICEHIKFYEADLHGTAIENVRPICYPAPHPPPPPITTTTPYSPTTSSVLDKACYLLCHTGAIYQLLSCCRK